MMSDLSATGAIVIAVAITMKFLIEASKKKPNTDENGNKILRLPRLYEIMGVIFLTISLIVLFYGLFDFNPENIIAQLLIFILSGGLGFLLVLSGRIYQVVFNDKEISSRNIFGKIKTIQWEDVKKASFSSMSAELKLDNGVFVIKCHQHLVGFSTLVDFLKTKLNLTDSQLGF